MDWRFLVLQYALVSAGLQGLSIVGRSSSVYVAWHATAQRRHCLLSLSVYKNNNFNPQVSESLVSKSVVLL